MARMIIKIDGETYYGISERFPPAKLASEDFREDINRLTSLSLLLNNGSYIVLGEKQIQRAIFIFND